MAETSDWRNQVIQALQAAGFEVTMDCADSVLMAEYRSLVPPGSPYDQLAESLAADLAKHARVPITRATCAALVRGAADLKAAAVLGVDAHQLLIILGVAAAKLEMQASPDA